MSNAFLIVGTFGSYITSSLA